jgi:hypothetical protein
VQYGGVVEQTSSARIRALIDRWVAQGRNVYVAKEPPFDPEDGGVPPAMWDGEPDPSGWVRWRAVEPRVASEDLARIEARLGATLPPLVRAWLSTCSLGPIETSQLRLPALWSDAPLRDLESALDAWAPLDRAGYVAAFDDADDAGPLCLDLGARDESGDCPVVAFDHEALLALGPAGCADRARVAALAQPRFPSFAALLDTVDRA